MYQKHPCCKTPKKKTTKIWRYMDVTKLLSILENRSLWFSNIAHLDDPLEGFLNRATVENFRTLPKNLSKKEKQEKQAIIEHNLAIIKNARYLLHVSSWNISEYESAAMWQLYLKNNEGVAIQSTYQRLKDSFKNTSEEIHIGMVQYIDNDNDIIDWSNAFNYAVHKRKSFEHEKELRAIVFSPYIAPKGGKIEVNVETLIEKIYVAPTSKPWILNLLKKIIDRYGLKIPLEQSRLFEDPLY